MTLWTTFCPQKICWEVTTVIGKGRGGTGKWLEHKKLIDQSLKTLGEYGISGIRLVIYPSEITQDGTHFDWRPIDTILTLAKKHGMAVDLCLGPFQYPNYPGIYLPQALLEYVYANTRSLDTVPALREFGEVFIQKQLERYGNDKRIRGFHLANEWPDKQRVLGREQVRAWISEAFMLWMGEYLKEHTDKPIALNTNIDASSRRRLSRAFKEWFSLLGKQSSLGFDIYPTQETWRKAPWQKLYRLWEPYHRSVARARKLFPSTRLFFCEVEAQPWGDGRSWYRIITSEGSPEEKVLQFGRTSLKQTVRKYLKKSRAEEVSLWGADFWLSAREMGITWPLEAIKRI